MYMVISDLKINSVLGKRITKSVLSPCVYINIYGIYCIRELHVTKACSNRHD